MKNSVLGTVSIDPDHAVAGARGTWTITYVAGHKGIEIGGSIIIYPPRRAMTRWEMGEVTAATDSDNTSLIVETHNRCPLSFHFLRAPVIKITVKDSPLRKKNNIKITIGWKGEYFSGYNVIARAQEFAMRAAEFEVYINPTGNQSYGFNPEKYSQYIALPKNPKVNILPNKPIGFRVVAHSLNRKSNMFYLTISLVDQYGNTVSDYQGNVAFLNTGGECDLPSNYSFSKEDNGRKTFKINKVLKHKIHRVSVIDFEKNLIGRSNPVLMDSHYNFYFGDMHVMTAAPGMGKTFMLGTTKDAYCYGRDIMGLDFVAITNGKDSTDASWDSDKCLAEDFYKPGEFVPLHSYECDLKSGHRNIIFKNKSEFRYTDKSVNELWRFLQNKEAIAIPHHPNICAEDGSSVWGPYNPNTHNPQYERLIEISQDRGSFEKDKTGDGVYFGEYGSSIQDLLAKGFKLGFVGGTDNHRSQPASKNSPLSGLDCRGLKVGGLTCVFAESLTRETLWNALWNRRCYATTGERILLQFSVDDFVMGSEIKPDENRQRERRIKVKVIGTAPIKKIEVVRNNIEIYTHSDSSEIEEFDYTDKDDLLWITKKAKDNSFQSVFYYVRVTQQDGGMAWSSPVWIGLNSNRDIK